VENQGLGDRAMDPFGRNSDLTISELFHTEAVGSSCTVSCPRHDQHLGPGALGLACGAQFQWHCAAGAGAWFLSWRLRLPPLA